VTDDAKMLGDLRTDLHGPALRTADASHSLRSKRAPNRAPTKLKRAVYEQELSRLQAALVILQEWVRAEGARVLIVFEGRDAAGKGSAIKRVTECLNPRVARVVALPAPTEREKTQWYFQRYVAHLPAAGEIVLMDRSWYNRAGVERVMGFCTADEYHRFLAQCPVFERLLVEDGIKLRKYWFSVSDAEQSRRFASRRDDPMRRWKLSPMDVESIRRWEDYSRAKDEMFGKTDIPEAPWWVVEGDDKRSARVNMIDHLISTVPYHEVHRPMIVLPERPAPTSYTRPPRELFRSVPDRAATL
jgi:polyphosphate kinase